MDKLWIVLLFLCVFYIGNNMVKRLFMNSLSSEKNRDALSAMVSEKEDPKVFWNEEGKRREPEQAEYDLSENDFFEKEETEFSENFEEEFSSLSDDEINAILEETKLLKKEGDAV